MRILIRNKKLAEGSVNVCTKCDEFFLLLHCEIPKK